MPDEISPANETLELFGHEAAELAFLQAFRSGRMHHAWLITGPAGIGKASFAFRAARYVLEHPDPLDVSLALHSDLSVEPESRAARLVAAGAHPNLLHLTRPYDEKNKRLKTVITIDEVRRTQGFFGSTAGQPGWRICVVDCADDLNSSAANALLKNLEEPSDKGLYLIVCHNPGRILPTIRSRCRTLRLRSLERPAFDKTLASILQHNRKSVSPEDLDTTWAATRGSVGKALIFLMSGGIDMARGFQSLTRNFPRLNRTDLHRFAQGLAGRGQDAEKTFDLFCDLAYEFAAERIRAPGPALATKAALDAAARSNAEIARDCRIYNFDRKQAVIRMVETLAEAAVSPISHTNGHNK